MQKLNSKQKEGLTLAIIGLSFLLYTGISYITTPTPQEYVQVQDLEKKHLFLYFAESDVYTLKPILSPSCNSRIKNTIDSLKSSYTSQIKELENSSAYKNYNAHAISLNEFIPLEVALLAGGVFFFLYDLSTRDDKKDES